MKKPFSLVMEDSKNEIIDILNKAGMPAFCIKILLTEILKQVEIIDQEEIKKYNKEKEGEGNEL